MKNARLGVFLLFNLLNLVPGAAFLDGSGFVFLCSFL